MSVNRISQTHARETEAVQNVNSQKSEKTATKADAVVGNNSSGHAEAAIQAQPRATTDNHARHEHGKQQDNGNDTNRTRVNVFA
jgi:hypothetical protein